MLHHARVRFGEECQVHDPLTVLHVTEAYLVPKHGFAGAWRALQDVNPTEEKAPIQDGVEARDMRGHARHLLLT